MTDPIADMLSRVRNASNAHHDVVSMPTSKLKANIADILKQEGYIADYTVEGHTPTSWLTHEVMEGLQRRFPRRDVPEEYIERAKYEISVIEMKGYPSYFLIVAELIKYARSVGIRVGPGRGSAAGALVAYALTITNIDPLEHDLLFERFLNPERPPAPRAGRPHQPHRDHRTPARYSVHRRRGK